MPWGPDVETNLAIRSANHLKVRFIQQSQKIMKKEWYTAKELAAFLIWFEAYKQLTKKEREKIIKFILREGLEKLIGYINCCEAILVE
ncbi:hypothetical protein [Arsenophonus endosymbiont of Aphis craccivora]|uniref:hypothetical protein n=1 Tax=Arsenophonus endosymbiont of Aphis craccivora TaxID=1231049 RepID=UPI00271520FF|nr:hypothetical protein [Arsenophonus endosymbiont of Aphis craccivora]